MKPLKLEMSAFGSYADQTEIDFTEVNHGIFLIAGDTGAGKTTIYDAINYALYDKTSGNQRDGNMMRSQYASLDVPTFVRLTFQYGDNKYTIKRNPEYIRESKRKKPDGSNEGTLQKAEVSLIMPDGSEFMGKKAEINKKIVEIIGLDANQFSQVVMIAQGDFLKLLHANSDDRKIIFSKIFNTRLYWKIEEELKSRYKRIYGQLEDNYKECRIGIDSIVVSENSEWKDTFYEYKDNLEPDFEKLLPFIKNIIQELQVREKQIKKSESELQKVLDEMNTQIKVANDNNQLFVQLDDFKRKLSELQLKKFVIDQKIVFVDYGRRAEKVQLQEEKYTGCKKLFDAAAARIMELDHWIEMNQSRVNERKLLVETLRSQKAEEESELQQIIARIDASDLKTDSRTEHKLVIRSSSDVKEIKTLGQLQVTYQDCNLDFARMEAENAELTSKKQTLEGLIENIAVLEKLNKIKKRDYHTLEGFMISYRNKLQAYENDYEAFLNAQAGILASALTEGEPCPVCGSTVHPNKTPLSNTAVTQEQVDRAKKERDLQESLRDKANLAFLKSKGAYDQELAYLEREAKKIISADFIADDNGLKLIMQKQDELHKKLIQCNEKLLNEKMRAKQFRDEADLRLQYLTHRVEEESDTYQELVNELEGKIGARNNEKANYLKLDTDCLNAQEQYLKAIADNGFTDEDDYKHKKLAEKELQIYVKEIDTFKEENIRISENVQFFTNQTKGKSVIEVDTLLGQQKSTAMEKEKAEEQHRIVYSSIQKNLDALKNLGILSEKRENLRKQYESISILSKTANGNLAGSAKIDFETYVLRQYFRQIIVAANMRLLKMVSNQFKLQCRNIDNLGGQGSSGLDLDVYSLVTNSTRDVKTLSGGESFMAALSMALGLADVIQNSAGAVHIETMFIDEGFGSLDDESREQAIMILNELAGNNRLVGIISHVTELKEQIDCKLIVEKSEKGSRVKWSF